jgi:hypothetical protein
MYHSFKNILYIIVNTYLFYLMAVEFCRTDFGKRSFQNILEVDHALTNQYLRTAVRFRPLHQYIKANRSRLAFFIAESCVFAGGSEEARGLHNAAWLPIHDPIPLSPAPSSLAPSRVKNLKSASTEISLITNQEVTRGLFKRLDGIIAYPEEITNPELPFGAEQVALQLLRV